MWHITRVTVPHNHVSIGCAQRLGGAPRGEQREKLSSESKREQTDKPSLSHIKVRPSTRARTHKPVYAGGLAGGRRLLASVSRFSADPIASDGSNESRFNSATALFGRFAIFRGLQYATSPTLSARQHAHG